MEISGEAVLEAIRKAGQELGRAPSRAELKRLTGVSHFVVLKHFPTLRRAVEAAGFTPHIKGRRATAADLLEDYGRVARLLGRRPSRAEYVRAGRFSAGTFTQRFGGWVEAGEEWERNRGESPQICAEKRRSEEMPEEPEISPQMNTENTDRKQERILSDPSDQRSSAVRCEPPAFILRPGQPAEIPGMRCVTEEVAAMIVGGLLGPRKWRLEIGDVEFSRAGSPQISADECRSEELPGRSNQHPRQAGAGSAISTQEKPQEFSPQMNTDDADRKQPELPGTSNQHSAVSTQPRDRNGTAVELSNYQLNQLLNSSNQHSALSTQPVGAEADVSSRHSLQLPNYQIAQFPNPLSNEIVIIRRAVGSAGVPSSVLHGLGWSSDGSIPRLPDLLRRLNVEVISGRLKRDRPVMGPPLHAFAMTNAPCNEAGVAALFCMIAPDLGFQIEAIQSAFPDCEARRQVRPGKWQRVRIEFEYESRNFPLHHHDASKCDMIVCWRHNWRKCPEEIEVLELRKMISIG
jgi:hypothetical protein